MNSRERILAAINHQPVDRVPTDIWATPEVMDKLRARFGSDEDVRQALHIDGIADIRPGQKIAIYNFTHYTKLNYEGMDKYVWDGEKPQVQISGPGLEKQPIPTGWLRH